MIAHNHSGAYRIQGASGSGKTIILIHRAIRLAFENPKARVRLFSINRSLATLLKETIAAIHGRVPSNLHVAAFYDFLTDILRGEDGANNQYRLVDPLSGERIAKSWHDFYRHRGEYPHQTVFALPEVEDLIESLRRRKRSVDPCQYLRDEVVYIQSAYRREERSQYLTEPRAGRGIPLLPEYREACLQVLTRWEDWLQNGDLCDVDGLTLTAGVLFEKDEEGSPLRRVRERFPTDHILVDEVQDFSTQELRILRRLVLDPDGRNRFFFVGDLNQKVFAKQHISTRAGFDLTGQSRKLTRNYRNTQQILEAAYQLPKAYPPLADDGRAEVIHPKLSTYVGERPFAFACKPVPHALRVVEIVQQFAGLRAAVVSENEDLLRRIKAIATERGIESYELFQVQDLDRWRDQKNGCLHAPLILSRLEAVKGFEFDIVIACDLSHRRVPREGTPPEEYWREAAVLYAALTRARSHLVMTYVDKRSVFLDAMAKHIDIHETGEELARALADVSVGGQGHHSLD